VSLGTAVGSYSPQPWYYCSIGNPAAHATPQKAPLHTFVGTLCSGR
jgi:hypothetical protein